MSDRRNFLSTRNVVIVACIVLAGALLRLDSKLDKFIEFGEYKAETRAASESVILLWQNEQTILAYTAAMRSDIKQLLAIEQDSRVREVLRSMLDRELALIHPGATP